MMWLKQIQVCSLVLSSRAASYLEPKRQIKGTGVKLVKRFLWLVFTTHWTFVKLNHNIIWVAFSISRDSSRIIGSPFWAGVFIHRHVPWQVLLNEYHITHVADILINVLRRWRPCWVNFDFN